MSENQYAPGTYVKGDVEREALSSRDAVALAFDGFRPKHILGLPEETAIEEPAAPFSPEETEEQRAERERLEGLADEEFKSQAPTPKPTNPKGNK